MVKIIKPGTKNMINCGFCGALLTYNKDDIKEVEKYLDQRESYFQKYITCPQCNNNITILEAIK